MLTSLLGFWRVKRWERGILASQQDTSSVPTATPSPFTLISRMEHTFGLRGASRVDLLRQGFGFGRPRRSVEEDAAVVRAEEGAAQEANEHALETDLMIPIDPNDPNRDRLIAQALAHDRRLQDDLRNAGLL